jgi:hypothetical protein
VTAEQKGRRLTPSVLMEHWDNGVPVAIPLAGTPELRLLVDSSRSRLTLRAPFDPTAELPPNALAHVTVETLHEGGVRYLEISTTDKELVLDGYSMLMAIADRIQLGGADPIAAFEQTLTVWESILSTRMRMGARAEIGLFGELLVVRGLLATPGAAGIDAWRGGLSEEHDFGFAAADVEVKTTSGERRRHWINGLAQLVETDGSALWVLSLQITRGGEQGWTLPELIDDVFALAGASGRDRVEQNLAGAGWHEAQRDLYTERWRLRTAPLLLRVDDRFPRLTAALLSEVAVDTAPLLQVDYEIDLTDRHPSPNPPPVVADVLAHMDGRPDD